MGIHDIQPVFCGAVQYRAPAGNACIVDQNVQMPQIRYQAADGSVNFRFIPHIEGNHPVPFSQFGSHGAVFLGISACGHHGGPRFLESQGNGPANTSIGTGDQGNFAGKRKWTAHGFLLKSGWNRKERVWHQV